MRKERYRLNENASCSYRARPVAQGRSALSFRLGFQLRQVSVQSVLRNSLAPVELLNAPPNLRVVRFPVFQKPAILFLLGLEQAEQDLLNTGRTCRSELPLDSGFERCVADFYVHAWLLGIPVTPVFFAS